MEVSGTVSHHTEVVASAVLPETSGRLHHISTNLESVELGQITTMVVLELNDEDKLVEEPDQAHGVELTQVDVPSLVTEFSDGVPVLAAVKNQDTGLVVSANSFLKGLVSVAGPITTPEEIERAKKQYTVGVVVEVTPTTSGTFARCSLHEVEPLSVGDIIAFVVQEIDFNLLCVVVGLCGAAKGFIHFTDMTDKLPPFPEDCVKRVMPVDAAVVETGEEMRLSPGRGPRGCSPTSSFPSRLRRSRRVLMRRRSTKDRHSLATSPRPTPSLASRPASAATRPSTARPRSSPTRASRRRHSVRERSRFTSLF